MPIEHPQILQSGHFFRLHSYTYYFDLEVIDDKPHLSS